MRYTMICIIHGDADYVYHDIRGNEHMADERALGSAAIVAETNPLAEVFIFHETPRTYFLYVFPRSDGELSYYRGGRLVATESYSRSQGTRRFDPEIALYRRYHVEERTPTVRLFLYFGHEIPEYDGAGYDASYPKRTFTVRDLADGMRDLLPDSATFDLAVLSSCFNGTPYTVATLSTVARHIVASPDNLHLSYFSLGALEHMTAAPNDSDVNALTTAFARQAFAELARDVQTSITVAAYDVARTMPFLNHVSARYDSTLAAITTSQRDSAILPSHCDCASQPAYVTPAMHDGVEIFYQPARFGRGQRVRTHSGWECWELPPLLSTQRE